ncbi:MAG: hypothetical protein ACRBCI_06300 [Cellvibrionaceae bacterium]
MEKQKFNIFAERYLILLGAGFGILLYSFLTFLDGLASGYATISAFIFILFFFACSIHLKMAVEDSSLTIKIYCYTISTILLLLLLVCFWFSQSYFGFFLTTATAIILFWFYQISTNKPIDDNAVIDHKVNTITDYTYQTPVKFPLEAIGISLIFLLLLSLHLADWNIRALPLQLPQSGTFIIISLALSIPIAFTIWLKRKQNFLDDLFATIRFLCMISVPLIILYIYGDLYSGSFQTNG